MSLTVKTLNTIFLNFYDIKYKQTGKSTVYIFHGISNVKKITTVFLHSYRNANVIWDVEKKIYMVPVLHQVGS